MTADLFLQHKGWFVMPIDNNGIASPPMGGANGIAAINDHTVLTTSSGWRPPLICRAMLCLAWLLCLALATPTHAEAPLSDLDDSWRLVSDRNDIRVYMRHRDESRLKTFRGITRIQLADPHALAAVLNDYDTYPRWLHFVNSAEEIRRDSDLLRYLRFTTLLPWPLANREAVLQTKVLPFLSAPEPYLEVHLTNAPEQLPVNDRYLRFPEIEGLFGVRDVGDNHLEVTYQLVLDPGGYIPAWLANILLRDAPYFTLERLRRIVHRPEYQNHYYPYSDLHGEGPPAATRDVPET